MATRTPATTADVSTPDAELSDLNRRIAEEAAAATVAGARRQAAKPAATTSDPAA